MEFRTDPFETFYECGEKIGYGHFAEVVHCKCRDTGEDFAAKFIRQRRVKGSRIGMDRVDIDREVEILGLLSHDNIITFREAFVDSSIVILVLELVNGGELFDYLSQEERLSEEEASQFLEQILQGVHHMHSMGIVHLDLKPENILIKDLASRKIKLVDFGLARRLKANESFQGIQGTADYVAPEIINYDPVSFATDMWSIGVITFMLLTGDSPFGGDTQQETFQNISLCDLDLSREEVDNVSDLARDFIQRLLIKDTRKRSTAAKCLVHPWIQPVEKEQVNRRRSSLITRETLVNLKKFVMDHSGPTSDTNSPCKGPRASLEPPQETTDRSSPQSSSGSSVD